MNFNIGALATALAEAPADRLASAIVNRPFQYKLDMVALGIGILVLLVVDPDTGMIHRVSLSRTNLAEGTLRMSDKKFEDITIPLDDTTNIIARAINEKSPQVTEDWKYLFVPSLTAEQARMNQAGGGIACSFVYPVNFDGGSAALIFSYYKFLDKVGPAEREFMQSYSDIVGQTLGSHKKVVTELLKI